MASWQIELVGCDGGRVIESPRMQPIERNKLAALLSFHLLWGFVLWFSISKLGLGISTDSVHLLFGAQNLSETGRLISFDGSRLLQWPPLYTALLAGIHLATGLSMFPAAHALHATAFVGQSICVSLLFLKMFPENFRLALAGNALADIGVVVVGGFDLLGSDYVHLFLITLYALLAGYYIRNNSPKSLVALAIVGMLAMLERYLGIAAIATGVVSMMLLAGSSLRPRLVRGLFLSLSALPAGTWLFLILPLIGGRAPISFAENFQWFSRSLLEWFLPAAVVGARPALYIALLWTLLAGLLVLLVWIGRQQLPSFAQPVLLYGLFYLLALFGSASIAYFNKLGGRFLLPLYIPFITLLLVCTQAVLSAVRQRSPRLRRAASVGASGSLAVVGALLLLNSVPIILQSHDGASGNGENAFNTAEWRANNAIRFWLTHRPKGRYELLSNYPDSIAFYTGHACNASPRQYSGPYGTVEFPVEGYDASMFASGQDVYLIWIEPNKEDYYYKPEELGPIADVRELFGSADGAVYQLRPKAKN